MRFYTNQKISSNREKTPEGFLLCRNTPIARTGKQEYGPDESGIKVGKDGRAIVSRDAEEVFAPKTVASVNGKSLTNNHPENDVTPSNWKQLTYGIFFDARRGTGLDEDILFADLLVTDEDGIGLIESGKVELSCGYDAEYEQTGEGTGRQKNIIVNHIALVDSGRCGPRCSVSDHRIISTKDCNCQKEASEDMKVKDRVRAALKAAGVKFKDAESEEKVMSEVTGDMEEPMGGAGDGDQHIHVHLGPSGGGGEATDVHDDDTDNNETPAWFKDYCSTNDARLDRIEQMIEGGGGGASNDSDMEEMTDDDEETEGEMEAEGMTGDMRRVKDSAMLDDSFQNTVALAEIIAPGIRLPTFDRAMAPAKTLGAITALRVKTLDLAWAVADTRGIIEDIRGNDRQPNFKKMKTSDVRTLFFAVGAAKRRANSRDGGTSHSVITSGAVGPVKTLAELNARNREHYKSN